jgi:hypothetical protein
VWATTGLTCGIAGNSSLTTCTIPLSVAVTSTQSVNIRVVSSFPSSVTGTWSTTYTQP